MAEEHARNESRLAATKSSYETDALMGQYLSLHFGPVETAFADFVAETGILSHALDFPKKCGDLVNSWSSKAGIERRRALDLGCAVGRASFEIGRLFREVVGIDISQTFIDMANRLKEDQCVEYELKVEGDITKRAVAHIDATVDTSRLTFLQVCETAGWGEGALSCTLVQQYWGALIERLADNIPCMRCCCRFWGFISDLFLVFAG